MRCDKVKLLKVDTLEEARNKLIIDDFKDVFEIEKVKLVDAIGRILAKDLVSSIMVPEFTRSTVDGYAVKASDTMGATDTIPVFLDLDFEVQMGQMAQGEVESGTCAYVPTGGMLPEGADAMVMVEYSEPFGPNQIALYSSVAPGTSLVYAGDDIKKGQTLLKAGRILKAQDLGVISSLGLTTVEVYKPLKVSIFSTGDEILEPGQKLEPGKVFDINTFSLMGEAKISNMEVVRTEVLKDIRSDIEQAIRRALDDSDIVILSGGSSQGKKDMTGQIIDEITKGGTLTLGLAIKPGKPTISAYDKDHKAFIFGLPGHPVASLLIFKLLVNWINKSFLDLEDQVFVEAKMTDRLASDPGKLTCQMVELSYGQEGYLAKPIFGKSALMTTLTKANAYVLIDRNQEGLKVGEKVRAYLL